MKVVEKQTLEALIGKDRGRKTFLEHEVKGLLRGMGVPVPQGVFLSKDEIAAGPDLAKSSVPALSYPLVAKVSSATITSKTDVQGVRVGLADAAQVKRALQELAAIEHAEGVLLEEMAPQGIEVIVGGIIDKQFGPVVMFGIGGIFVELFKDVSFGLAPMSEEDALILVKQVKGHVLLSGFRGRPPVDIEMLSTIIVRVSELMATGLIEEIDLNPVCLYPKGAIVLDAKMSILQS